MTGGSLVQNAAGWKLTLSPPPPEGGGGVAGLAQDVAATAVPAIPSSEVKLSHTLLRADVTVAKGIGLDGGRTQITLERVPFRILQNILGTYEKAQASDAKAGAKGGLTGVLKLFWRVGLPYPGLDEATDLIQGALGVGDTDVVARFVVTGMSVDSEKGGYRLTIDGVDAAWHALSTRKVKSETPLSKPEDIRDLCSQLSVEAGMPKAGGLIGAAVGAVAGAIGGALGGAVGTKPSAPKSVVTPKERVLDRLAQFEAAVVQDAKAGGLGAYLIDNGRLLYGADVVETFKATPNDLGGGLSVISIKPQGRNATDHSGNEEPFTLQIRGDAAIKPGQVLKFRYKKQSLLSASTGLGYADAAIGLVKDPLGLGAEGDPVCLYVRTVRHRQSSSIGFITEVDGIKCGDASPTMPARAEKPSIGTGSTSPDATAGVISAAIDRRVPKLVDVGELTTFRSQASDGAPGQTSDLKLGLDPTRGGAQAFRTAPVEQKDPQRSDAVPYVTPFAWGAYGLVLPRYAGMRLALLRPEGKPEEALDIGALWWSGRDRNEGAGPSKAQDGDYWLILPVDPPSGGSASAPSDGKACHDLIDKNGRRTLEVRELTVRVGDWAVTTPSARPKESSASKGLRIEGKDGKAFIEIDEDGKIRIGTTQSLELSADEGITLKSKNITVDIKNGIMDVT